MKSNRNTMNFFVIRLLSVLTKKMKLNTNRMSLAMLAPQPIPIMTSRPSVCLREGGFRASGGRGEVSWAARVSADSRRRV